jgi:hypothetical protein
MINSKAYTKLIFLVLPVLAVAVIWVVHSQMGGLAPAPPVSIPQRDAALIVPRPKQQTSTVLAPQGGDFDVPPGGALLRGPDEFESANDVDELRIATPIPILELNPPTNRR